MTTNRQSLLNRSPLFYRIVTGLFLLCIIFYSAVSIAQNSSEKRQILVDISHGQKFYNDPANMQGKDSALVKRVEYMTGELSKNAGSLNADIGFLNSSITPDVLSKCDLLFIHMPSSAYNETEIKAIRQYIGNGGALFLVMEVDYWSTLAQANVNDIVSPFGIVFKGDHPNQKSGGYSKSGSVTTKRYSIPCHGARIVEGGTPFCYSIHSEDHPFGVYKDVKNGGRIIAMGEGMVSLYMTSWEGVNNYQCSEFMHDAFAWLLK